MTTVPPATCADAYRLWADGRIDFAALRDGAILTASGARCPVAQAPELLQVQVHTPPGQPAYTPPEIGAGTWWVAPLLTTGLVLWLLILAGMALLRRWEDKTAKEAT